MIVLAEGVLVVIINLLSGNSLDRLLSIFKAILVSPTEAACKQMVASSAFLIP